MTRIAKHRIAKDNPTLVSAKEDFEREMKDPEFRRMYDAEGFKLEVAIALIKYRKEKKISQQELAKRIATSQSAVARIELGQQNMTLETVSRIASVFGKRARLVFDDIAKPRRGKS